MNIGQNALDWSRHSGLYDSSKPTIFL
jgi:hypothetical protein